MAFFYFLYINIVLSQTNFKMIIEEIMKHRILKLLSFLIFCITFTLIFASIPYGLISGINSNSFIAIDELKHIEENGNNLFFKTTVSKLSAKTELEEKVSEYVIKYKLFNSVNIKNLKVKVVNDNLVYPGGNCVGLSFITRGVELIGNNSIISKTINVNTLIDSNLKV